MPRETLSGRGLAYWTDGKDERILYVTPGYRLIALEARTGNPIKSFGEDGVVDLKLNDDQKIDLETGEIGLASAPVVARDVIIIGAAFKNSGIPKSKTNNKGYVRGFDVRTGKRLWIFHTIPLKGEFGYDTWERGSAEYTGNAGAWTQMSVDEDLGLAYLPVELPTGDYYGGDRPGSNLFGETLVAVDLKTGKRKWHYQLVHHGMWDFDISCAPLLADINVDGRAVKAVAQATKQGFLYVFNRETGQPVWPIVERPVEVGNTPGEWYSPTQPFPTKPPAFSRNGVSTGRFDRFHSGTPRRSSPDRLEISHRARLHARSGEQAGRSDRNSRPGNCRRRGELGRQFLRSRYPHALRACLQCLPLALWADPPAIAGRVGSRLHQGHSGAEFRSGVRRWAKPDGKRSPAHQAAIWHDYRRQPRQG